MFLCFTVIRDQKARWRADHLTRLGGPPAFLSFSRPGQALAWLRFSNDKIGYDAIGVERIFQKIPRSPL